MDLQLGAAEDQWGLNPVQWTESSGFDEKKSAISSVRNLPVASGLVPIYKLILWNIHLL